MDHNWGVSPSLLPTGEPLPSDGSLPMDALSSLAQQPFGFYVHVPYCATRCGYCDFNTYTAEELGPGVRRETYAHTVIDEVRFATKVLGPAPPVQTVFFGGGTPTPLPPPHLPPIPPALADAFGV